MAEVFYSFLFAVFPGFQFLCRKQSELCSNAGAANVFGLMQFSSLLEFRIQVQFYLVGYNGDFIRTVSVCYFAFRHTSYSLFRIVAFAEKG